VAGAGFGPVSGPTGRRERQPVRIDLLFVEGCPHARRALAEIDRAVRRSSVPADISLRMVGDSDEALAAHFLGSPSIRVAGRDVEPGAEARGDSGIKCRLYRAAGSSCGTPPEAWLREALHRR
jgi:hypothetical protein